MIAPQFGLDPKVAKDQDSRQASLRTWPYPAKPAEPGLETFTPCFAVPVPRFSKISYALQPHRPASFCRFSAEAFLLSGVMINYILIANRGQSPTLFIIFQRANFPLSQAELVFWSEGLDSFEVHIHTNFGKLVGISTDTVLSVVSHCHLSVDA